MLGEGGRGREERRGERGMLGLKWTLSAIY